MDKLQDHHGMYLFCDPGGMSRESGGGGGGEGELSVGGGGGGGGGYCLPHTHPHIPGGGGMSGGDGGYPHPSSIMSSAPSPSPGACAPLYHYPMPPDPLGLSPGGTGMEGGGGGLCKALPDFPWMKEKKAGRKEQSQMAMSNAGEKSMIFVEIFYLLYLYRTAKCYNAVTPCMICTLYNDMTYYCYTEEERTWVRCEYFGSVSRKLG